MIFLKCHFTGFEQSHEQSVATDSSSTIDQVEQETRHTSAESLVVSLSSTNNDSDHESGVTATSVHLSEKQTEPIDGSGDDDNLLLLTLLTSPAPHLLGTSISPKALDVEASSPQELEATVTESNTPSDVHIINEEVKQFEQERVEKTPFLHTTPTTPLTETKVISSKDSTGHEDNSSGTENSSGGGALVTDLPYPNATPIIPFKSTDLLLLNTTEVKDTESISSTNHFAVEVTLIPEMTLTPIWDTMTPPTPPQEFRADVEISGDTPVTTDDPDSSAESDPTAVPTTEYPEESLTSSLAPSDKEHDDQDLTTTTESPNSNEEDELTTLTHHTTTHPRTPERVLDRTGISGNTKLIFFFFFSKNVSSGCWMLQLDAQLKNCINIFLFLKLYFELITVNSVIPCGKKELNFPAIKQNKQTKKT